jgi:uncharacterized membrane protein YhaH (DUF805 family)
MSFTDAIRICLTQKFAVFEGRARRSEYWWFVLFNLVVQAVLELVLPDRGFGGVLQGLIGLAVFIPYVSVLVRRLHDLDRTAWWALLLLLPVVGTLVLIFFTVQRGTDGPNRFGADPVRTPIGAGPGVTTRDE